MQSDFVGIALRHNVVVSIDVSIELPPLDEEGKDVLVPKVVVDFKEHTLRKRTIREYLVKCKNLWRMLLGRVSRYCSLQICNCLRTSNFVE